MSLEKNAHRSDRWYTLSERFDIDVNIIRACWDRQQGMCAVTGMPMSLGDDPWYGMVCAPRLAHMDISGDNMILTCAVVEMMRPSDMAWKQFEYICALVPSCEDED